MQIHLSPAEDPGQFCREQRQRDTEVQRVFRRVHAVDEERRVNEQQRTRRRRDAERSRIADASDANFPDECSKADKYAIIQDWQNQMNPSRFHESACAVCGWGEPLTSLTPLTPSSRILNVLRNESLMEHVVPRSYDFHLYRNAILCPDGMESCHTLAPIRACSRCRQALLSSPPRQPRFALANYLYYGIERLPSDVSEAFLSASPFERLLISRCRSTTVTHHYVRRGRRGGYVPEESSQRFNRGNVALFPQDPGALRDVLPPSPNDIRDTVCVLFSGGKKKPTAETLKNFAPVLVRKSKVAAMISFLLEQNEWYRATGVRFSQKNMDDLFAPGEAGEDIGVLQSMEVDHVGDGDQVASENDEDWVELQDDIVMDNVGYTLGDHSPRSRESMKAHALAYALDHRRFINSQAGTAFLGDSHPGLLAYLFPHLDPWGIGGFHHPGRTGTQRLSFEMQVKCLLRQFRSPFARDALFPFICWNIIQKQAVSRQSLFSVKTFNHHEIATHLDELRPHLTNLAIKWTRDPNARAESNEEKQVVGLLQRLQLLSKNIKGSPGYKLCRRNEIRSLIRKLSTPALFVTLNPHDLSSAIIGVLGGMDECTWRAQAVRDRAIFVANHPDYAARAFDATIAAFLQIIVRFGKGKGLFG
ncbi:hypothetical protein L210DRAFT_3390581, partial [Boletus edulis BED1]